jgi:hypothetical protein
VILVERHAVRGGETRVFEADSPRGIRFVMDEPWARAARRPEGDP